MQYHDARRGEAASPWTRLLRNDDRLTWTIAEAADLRQHLDGFEVGVSLLLCRLSRIDALGRSSPKWNGCPVVDAGGRLRCGSSRPATRAAWC